MKKILFLLFTFFLIFGQQVFAADNSSSKFVTLVYPVRGRDLWVDPNVNHLEKITDRLKNLEFPSTWLFQYDALIDPELVAYLNKNCQLCEFGLFFEVSKTFSTDASVSYDTSDNNWARPNKVFLSGYRLLERKRLIDTVIAKFKSVFGYYPKSIGAWYIDPYSLQYLVNKYGVQGYVSVADQFDTDAQKYWGKPWGYPFYPDKFNILAPATNLQAKLGLVELQWAQRDPTDGYGQGVKFSQNSFQANDYIGNGNDTTYFKNLLHKYLDTKNDEFAQVTIGLEVGQELENFSDEHLRQLDVIKSLSSLTPMTISGFTQWYQESFPALSPITIVSDGQTSWINMLCYRVGIKKFDDSFRTFDLRFYDQKELSPDIFSREKNRQLVREINLKSEGFTESCRKRNWLDDKTIEWKTRKSEFIEKLGNLLSFIKWSVIDGRKIIGIGVQKDTLFGYWWNHGFGLYHFGFQQLVKFQSPGSLILNRL